MYQNTINTYLTNRFYLFSSNFHFLYFPCILVNKSVLDKLFRAFYLTIPCLANYYFFWIRKKLAQNVSNFNKQITIRFELFSNFRFWNFPCFSVNKSVVDKLFRAFCLTIPCLAFFWIFKKKRVCSKCLKIQ